MSGALQAVFQNLRSFGFPNGWPANIGGAFGGGYFAGQIIVNGYAVYNLVVADKTVGEAYGKKWGTLGVNTGVTSLIDGPANTTTLAGLGADYEAAIFCENLNTGGFTDWYLPSFNEQATIYYYLKPSTTINNTGTGATANAVSPQPISTNYTTGNPAQTSAISFRNGASSQEFVLANYWVSLAYVPLGNNNAWTRDFTNGEENVNTKTITTYYTRAVRRVLAYVTPPTTIGQAFAGGFYAGKISTSADGVATHYLVVSNASVGQTTGLQWGPTGVTTGFQSRIAGPTNSAGLAALGSTYQAATFCENLNTGGYTDWYMPAQNEVKVLYYFLKPGTTTNNTGFGANVNAVSPEPYNTNYTSGDPAQTSATSFRTGASSQEFSTSAALWTSTESDVNPSQYAWRTFFDDGREFDYPKTATTFYIRAVRRVPI